MTQNTQTTRERIAVLIHWEGIVEAPNIIAAEIDALTAERDEARAQYRREKTITATLEHQLSGWNESYLKVEAERDEARAKVADWEHEEGLAEIANTQINLHYAEVAKNRELTAQLADARAEVERLRLPAEAWLYKQACEAWDAGKITPFEFAEAHKLYSPQARRARAAKGTP